MAFDKPENASIAFLSSMNYFRNTIYFILVTFVCYKIFSLIIFTYTTRRRYQDIPSLQRHWFWGNLIAAGEKCSPSRGRHPDYGFEEIWDELDRPSCFLVDLAPIEPHSFLIVCEPSIAEAVAQPSADFKWSMPKSDTLRAMHRLIGRESLISAEGEEWRSLRKRLNRGFAPAHLHGLSPLIISNTRIFIERIQEAARTGAVVALKDFAQDLTTDIITQLTIEKDFESQSIPAGEGPKGRFGVLTASHILSSLVSTTGQGFDLQGWLNPIRGVKERLYEQLFNRTLYSIISQKLREEENFPKKKDASTKAIVQLALADMEPTPALLRNAVSQVKSFIFAGQDTTATLIQWLCFELSKADYDPRYRKIIERLEAEHNAVFGTGAYSALQVLEQPGQAEDFLGGKIPYTTAFIKEALRLHPPAGTARLAPETSQSIPPFCVEIDGHATDISSLRVYNCQWIMHRNPKVWGDDARIFNPDRWLDEVYMSKLPTGAWRPFERGPRNCIGQELAMLEAKVVMCAVTRGLRFKKVGLSGRDGEPEVWSTQNVTSVPVDGMRMKFHQLG